MKKIRLFIRLIHINFILARHGLDNVILSLKLFAPLRFFLYLNPVNWHRKEPFNRGRAIRYALEDLGPIYVKFGQALSTRRDLLPEDIAIELSKLQDDVMPFPGDKALELVEKAYGRSVNDVFKSFDVKPLASASIAQVHPAQLKNGNEVVVKILRPKIKKQIKRDISLMYSIARLADKYWADAKRLRVIEVVEEFEKTIYDELDFQREASNASQLRRNFIDSDILYVPEIHWEYTHRNVLVMERIEGIPISNMKALKEHGVNIKKLAERGVEIFFTQVFNHSFFHADMHPGNLFVSFENPENPKYICVDFGIMGSLSPSDQRYIAENFKAFFNHDYHRVAELHIESGWVPATTRITELEAAIRTVSEPIFDRPLSQFSFAQMLLRLFQTGRRFNMEIQPQLILLQKTLFAIEGLGRELYPDLNLWENAKPFIENWIAQQLGPRSLVRALKHHAPYWVEQIPELPGLLHSMLSANKQQRLIDGSNESGKTITQTALKIKKSRKRSFLTGFASALLLSALLLNPRLYEATQEWISAMSTTQLILSGVSVILLFLLWFERQ